MARTWDGARLFRVGENWDVDLFWMQPVVVSPTHLDSPDDKQNFAGGFVTNRPKKGTFLDAYYLMLENTNTVLQNGVVQAPIRKNNDWSSVEIPGANLRAAIME